METINNMASAAAQVVWPTSADNHNSESSNTGSNTGSAAAGEEPLSGVQGDTSKGEPYDAGNKADQDALDAAAIKDSKAPSAVQEPGPRPLADVARERGGDAGPYSSGPSSGSAVPSGPTGRDDDSDPYKPQAHSHGEGTGEQYVRSTGLHADGGDFDAANPGAGREADRIIEEKGIAIGGHGGHSDHTDDHDASTGAASHDQPKEKKGLGQKIKAKIRGD